MSLTFLSTLLDRVVKFVLTVFTVSDNVLCEDSKEVTLLDTVLSDSLVAKSLTSTSDRPSIRALASANAYH